MTEGTLSAEELDDIEETARRACATRCEDETWAPVTIDAPELLRLVAVARERDRLRSALDVVENNAWSQATLLADTGRRAEAGRATLDAIRAEIRAEIPRVLSDGMAHGLARALAIIDSHMKEKGSE
jgi:hypothetical protein